jgi:hypothetical protein
MREYILRRRKDSWISAIIFISKPPEIELWFFAIKIGPDT